MNEKPIHNVYGIVIAMLLYGLSAVVQAEPFRLVIAQDEKGAVQKYAPLAVYLKAKGIDVSLIEAPDFAKAAQLFKSGEVDGMISGSAAAGTVIGSDLATPIARPVIQDGYSTYWAVVLAHSGAPKFTGSADYFEGKRVAFAKLASAGEMFYLSLPGAPNARTTTMKVASHGEAIEALSKGAADVAIVKNRVWNTLQGKYPNLVVVGEDSGENPDRTLIVSKKTSEGVVKIISNALLSLKDDNSAEAKAVRDSLGVKEYITTTKLDFQHTLELLKKAGLNMFVCNCEID